MGALVSDCKKGGQIDDSWWGALAVRMLHPVEVQIVEALRHIDQPLSAGELFRACEEKPHWFAFVQHVRRLSKLRAIMLAEAPLVDNPLETRYRLVVEEESDRA